MLNWFIQQLDIVKRNVLGLHASTWINLKKTVKEKARYKMTLFMIQFMELFKVQNIYVFIHMYIHILIYVCI